MTEFQHEKNKVSILIPVYNRELLLEECIQSALNQTYDNFEVVIVDNASTDKTWEVCQAWAKRDERIRVFRNDENIGPVRNWQRCLDEATGEFCKFLFSDDMLDPKCIEEMVQKLAREDVAFVYCPVLIGKSFSKSVVNYARNTKSALMESDKYLSLVLKGLAPVSPGAVMLRSNDLRNSLSLTYPTTSEQFFGAHGAGPDVMIMLRTADGYKYVSYISTPLVFFRIHELSLSIINRDNIISSSYQAILFYYMKTNSKTFDWLTYAAKVWIKNVFKDKKLINVRRYMQSVEGSGSLFESIMMISLVPWALLSHLIRK